MKHLFYFVFITFLSVPFSVKLCAKTEVFSKADMVKLLEKQGVKFTDNNDIVFFHTGQAKFNDLFKAVRQAKSSIHMEYFNFRDDSIANALFSLLAQKVKEGVEVRLIYDAFGNASNNKPIKHKKLQQIRDSGIKIYEFDPIVFPWVNHITPRDHRKIVIIDGKTAYSGGMNVADYYIKGKPDIGSWHDIHYRIEGDAVAEYQSIFLRMWKKVSGEDVSGTKYYPGESFKCNALKGLEEDTTATAGKKRIGIINREPHTSPKIIRRTFLYAIHSAQHLIQIINPYFTLNGSIRRALKNAIKRGVEVEIMVSEKSDIPITPRIVDYEVRQLMKAGAEVYFYQGGFHHSKIMMIDGELSYVGSANLDSRSLRCDYECNALILDAASTHELQNIFNHDKIFKSVRLTDEYWKKRPHWKNFQSWFYHFLAPVVYVQPTKSDEHLCEKTLVL
ncbi:MAG: cardiolipin synthase [Bacteroidaceae bacterium]|jgi:cardiolipin synthase